MTTQVLVSFFPASASLSAGAGASAASCGTGDTGCCGPAAAASGQTVDTLAEAVRQHFEGKVAVEVATYWSEADVGAAITRLNTVLAASGRSFEVTPVNFYTFVETVGPVVAIGDQLLCTRRLPEWDELRDAVEKVALTV